MQRLYSKPLVNLAVNIAIIGMNGSGKSAIVVKYLTRRFIVEYAPYLSDNYTKSDTVDGQDVTLNIQDTSDSDDIDLEEIVKWSQAVVILFSITSRRSFYRAQELIESIKQTTESQPVSRLTPNKLLNSTAVSSLMFSSSSNLASVIVPASPGYSASLRRSALYNIQSLRAPTIVLVANKSDLDRFRLVEKGEAEDYAKVQGIPYFETTAVATYDRVQSIFHAIVRLTHSTKFGRNRAPDTLSTPTTRSLSSSAGSVSSTSVLSSLAVSPGLLLQKKTFPLGSSATGQENVAAVTVSTTEAENSTNPVSRLANLRFRATSPPTFAKNFRSVSPGSSNTRNEPTTATNLSHTHSFSTAKSSAEPGARATTPITLYRIHPPSPSSKQISSSEEGPGDKSANTAIASAQPNPSPAPVAPLPPKKTSMAFRFFGKKSK